MSQNLAITTRGKSFRLAEVIVGSPVVVQSCCLGFSKRSFEGWKFQKRPRYVSLMFQNQKQSSIATKIDETSQLIASKSIPLHSSGIEHQIKLDVFPDDLSVHRLPQNRGFIHSNCHIHLPMQAWTCSMDGCLRADPKTIHAGPFCKEGPHSPFQLQKHHSDGALAWGWIHSVDLFSWLLRLFAPWII